MINSASPPKTIDEYLSRLPDDVHAALEKLRKTIQAAAPKAEEVISYGMPAFKYNGILVYFAAFKNHCSLFPGSTLFGYLDNELKPYKTSKGTLQFTLNKPIPTSLVKKIVKLRIQENDARLLAKKLKKVQTKKTGKKKVSVSPSRKAKPQNQ